jgi:cytochrome c
MNFKSAWLAALTVLAGGTALAADPVREIAYGRHLSQECQTCHRIDGVDNGIPSIIAWDVDTFVTTLAFYKAGARTNPAMVSVAQSLDDAQVRALAAYYASLPKPAPKKAATAKVK